MSKVKERILVPIDFSPCSDAALRYALALAEASGAEVEVLHVWRPRHAGEHEGAAPRSSDPSSVSSAGRASSGSTGAAGSTSASSQIFADTPEGLAMEARLSAAESSAYARVSGRLEFGAEPSQVILDILERERFDMVVMGQRGGGDPNGERAPESGRVAARVAGTARCKVVTMPPPPGDTEAA